MKQNNEQTYLEKEIEKIIVNILIPITDELKSKTKEIKEKRIELKKEMNDLKQLKQSLNEKRKKLNKQKAIYENHMNSDFSNVKICKECLTNYINIIDKKQTDFLKEKDDYYEIKLRRKELEFNNLLLDIVKEKTNSEKKKIIRRKMSFEAPRRLNKSSNSNQKNLNKSFKSDSVENEKSKTKNKTKYKSITPRRDIKKNQKNKNNIEGYKDKKIKRKNSNESNNNKNDNLQDISREIEKLINNYNSKKNRKKNSKSINSENYNDGLEQLKIINQDTKSIENDLKEMMDNFINQEKESESNF